MENPRALGNTDFCSVSSRDRQEKLAGTAVTSTPLWIGLEHTGLWPRKPLDGCNLPPDVVQELRRWTVPAAGVRFQFIRQTASKANRVRLFIGNVEQTNPWLVRFDLESAQDLLELKLIHPADAKKHPLAVGVEDSHIWVCTHGKRDRCCAKYGRALYDALSPLAPDRVWQTSHLGGHRFAPTLVTLPDGLCYGHVLPDEVQDFMDAHARSEIYNLARLRGHVSYTAEQQTADIYLRETEGFDSTQVIGHPNTRHHSEDECSVHFRSGSHERVVHLARKTMLASIKSCNAEATVSSRWCVNQPTESRQL